MGKDARNMEVSKRANTNEYNNARRAEVWKSTEFSLPQAQVFYISSRNKFIIVKTTNLAFAFFFIYPGVLQYVAAQLFLSPADPAWPRK